jgi:hypothetical protein
VQARHWALFWKVQDQKSGHGLQYFKISVLAFDKDSLVRRQPFQNFFTGKTLVCLRLRSLVGFGMKGIVLFGRLAGYFSLRLVRE